MTRCRVHKTLLGPGYLNCDPKITGDAGVLGGCAHEVQGLRRVAEEWPEGPPARFAFDLFPPALDRLETSLMAAMELIPALGEVGFKSIVNGPTIWTGDSLARCGRARARLLQLAHL